MTQEWLDEVTKLAQGQPERPGATGRMQYVLAGAPDGKGKFYRVIEDGKLAENRLGTLDDADITVTLSWEDSVQVAKGLDPNTAFMQGRMKVTGDMAKVMSLMPMTNSPEYQALQEEIRGITDF